MNRIDRLRDIHAEIENLKDEDKRLSTPIIMNMGIIRNLYDVFCMALKRQDPHANPKDANSRKKFLYAILYIFSPATLVGDVMRHKLREFLSRVIGNTPTGVSRDYKTGVFFYVTYSDFRKDVDSIISEMLQVLGKDEEL